MLRWIVLIVAMVAGPAVAEPNVQRDRDAILQVIEHWYAELAQRDDGNPYRYTAPGFIEGSPIVDYADTQSAVLGPPIYASLAARALQFSYDVTDLVSDNTFAKARVWERGYFYASAGHGTYELAASALFLFEREAASGRWLIIAHESNSVGIPESMKTNPLPDLREEWRARSPADFMLLDAE